MREEDLTMFPRRKIGAEDVPGPSTASCISWKYTKFLVQYKDKGLFLLSWKSGPVNRRTTKQPKTLFVLNLFLHILQPNSYQDLKQLTQLPLPPLLEYIFTEYVSYSFFFASSALAQALFILSSQLILIYPSRHQTPS